MLKSSRDKKEGMHRTKWGEGKKGPLCDPGSELLCWEGSTRVILILVRGLKKKKCTYRCTKYDTSS